MSFVSLGLGLSIAVIGLLSIAWPESFAAILRESQTLTALYLGAGSRVLLGISLLLSAPSSRAPATLRVLGMLFLVVGLVMPFRGLEVFRAYAGWFLSLGSWAVRVWGLVAMGFGLSIAYAVSNSLATRSSRTAGE